MITHAKNKDRLPRKILRWRQFFFSQFLFPFRTILCCIFSSGVLHALLLIHSADACFLVMACVGYLRAQLKTLLTLLKSRAQFPSKYECRNRKVACNCSK